MLTISVYNSRQHFQYTSNSHEVEFGVCGDGNWQVADAAKPAYEKSLTLTCVGTHIEVHAPRLDVWLAGRPPLESGVPAVVDVPAVLMVGDTYLEITRSAPTAASQRPFEVLAAGDYQRHRNSRRGGPAADTLGRWFAALGTLHRTTAADPQFFADAARFVTDPVGLDGAMVLRKTGAHAADWEIVASSVPQPQFGVGFSADLVRQAVQNGQTMFHSSPGPGQAVVIAPLTGGDGQPWGAIYGYRAVHAGNGRRAVRYLEAHLVELLSQSVNCGIARLASDVEAARRRVMYEQAFSPSVARHLESNPQALKGNEREVTVLFADLRGFSQLCQRLPASDTYVLLNEIMDALTAAVMQHDGTLIDYYGDGLAAMWNAPLDQPQHPTLACRAALTMQQSLPEVSNRWRKQLSAPLELGVGIHTGTAQVGNIGSTERLKYGPRGSVVNIASRLERAAKLTAVPVVVSPEVAQRLTGEFLHYRICQAMLPGIDAKVQLFAVSNLTHDPTFMRSLVHYEEALEQFEAGKLGKAREALARVREAKALPAKFLLDEIQREEHRRLGRRASDHLVGAGAGAIPLDAS